MKSVVVLDYGFGNVRSMVRALANVGVDVTLTSDYNQAFEADGLVVPGVGAFASCVEGLRRVNGDRVIARRILNDRPVLGVCVGLQIMFSHGNEGGSVVAGLDFMDGLVEKLDAPVVPHMGWNTVEYSGESTLLQGLDDERFYFVHSYGVLDAPSDVSVELIVDDDDSSRSSATLTPGSANVLPDNAVVNSSVLANNKENQQSSLVTLDENYRQAIEEFKRNNSPQYSWCTYGDSRFVASFERGALSGTQFHPEKSADAGQRLLTNWLHTL